MTTVNTGAPGAADDATGQPTATTSPRPARGARPSRAARVRRGIGMVAVIAAGAGVIGLGTGVGTAAAEPAPAHAGWDGSRYWFKNSQGQWRWTTHYDIYLARTGGSDTSSGSASGSGSSADAAAPAAPAADGDVEAAVQFALAQLGKPFRTAGNGPDGYDCSGLVQQAFRRGDIELPRVANDQYAATTPVTASQLRRGDLLFWSDDGSARGIHHVAIYLGNNQYVEAARPGTLIRISGISSGYYPTHMGRP
ncbi:C40 family peptidase [Kitasatospora purpeofusca]|uniref:C40 family peptidase n=1 Tax=Kitasatospora purpeofusca TaxID=67352 RepID=UPI0035E37407